MNYTLTPESIFLSVSLNVYLSGLLFLPANDLLAIKDIDFVEMDKNEN